mmetsp:Transcript_38916/g.101843  ORF Transcript_38916/g.101843 Transcript_38916/m.101843 type:complete len:110 (-) Transcript_38916:137-466(-)
MSWKRLWPSFLARGTGLSMPFSPTGGLGVMIRFGARNRRVVSTARSPLAALAASKYGNFVIQHILEDCTIGQKQELGDRLRALGSVLRRGFGKHLLPLLGKGETRLGGQ